LNGSCSIEWWENEELQKIVYEDVKVFAGKLKKLRQSRGLSIKQLSDEIRWAESCIENWESAYLVPGQSALRTLSTYFFVPEDYFLNGSINEFKQLTLFD
jgi:ribosome-binding protein aMBF1 (putative translation factor)